MADPAQPVPLGADTGGAGAELFAAAVAAEAAVAALRARVDKTVATWHPSVTLELLSPDELDRVDAALRATEAAQAEWMARLGELSTTLVRAGAAGGARRASPLRSC